MKCRNFLSVILLLIVSVSYSQEWRRIVSPADLDRQSIVGDWDFKYSTSGFQFLNDSVGYIAYNRNPLQSMSGDEAELFKTEDGGITWERIRYVSDEDLPVGLGFLIYDENRGAIIETNGYQYLFKELINDQVGDRLPLSFLGGSFRMTFLNSDTLIAESEGDWDVGVYLYSYVSDTVTLINICENYCVKGGCFKDNTEIARYHISSNSGHAVSYDNDRIVFYHTSEILGEWESDTLDLTGKVQDIFFFDESSGFLAMGGKLYKTDDTGVTWNTCIDTERQINKIAFKDNRGYVIGEDGMIWETIDHGETWSEIASFTTGSLAYITILDNSNVYVATEGAQIYTNSELHVDEENLSIGIVPVPAYDIINVDSHVNEPCRILIVDAAGKIICSFESTDALNLTFDISNLERGLYFVLIETEVKRYYGKFIKVYHERD